MADSSDYYSGQRVDSLARCVALGHHDARVGGSIPGLGSFNTFTRHYLFGAEHPNNITYELDKIVQDERGGGGG